MNDIGALLAATREVAAAKIAPEASRVDRERAFPAAGLRALGEAGVLGVVVPAEHGGAGGVARRARRDLRGGRSRLRLDRDGLPDARGHGGDDRRRGRRAGGRAAAAASASGDAVGTLAFSERGTGAHFYNPELKAERTNGAVTISGRKSFVTSGGHADLYLVLVQGEAEGTADAYLVGRDDPGVAFDGAWSGLGMAGNSSIALELDGVQVGDGDRIGGAGRGGERSSSESSRRTSSSASRRSTSASRRPRRPPRRRMPATAATPTARRSPRCRRSST